MLRAVIGASVCTNNSLLWKSVRVIAIGAESLFSWVRCETEAPTSVGHSHS